jgi:outer membrane biosynthesis protein TonB
VRTAVPNGIIVALILAVSVVMAGAASTLALHRPDLDSLDASLEPRISADYSRDDDHLTFAPLDEAVISVAQDDGTQGTSNDVEILEPFRLQPPEDAGDEPSTSPTPTPTPAASETPQPSVTSGSSTPMTRTFTPTPTPTPTPKPTPTPNPNVTTAPTLPSVRTPTPTSTPTPTPTRKDLTFYLHENPWPPTGDSISSPTLPMAADAPVATILYNYDTDFDSGPGILIARGGQSSAESDPKKYQSWWGPAASAAYILDGTVTVTLWSATKDFQINRAGAITAYLGDCSSSCTTIGSVHYAAPNWQSGSPGWRSVNLTIQTGSYGVPAGHWLQLKIIVTNDSEADLWFAYDTTAYPSRIELSVLQQ